MKMNLTIITYTNESSTHMRKGMVVVIVIIMFFSNELSRKRSVPTYSLHTPPTTQSLVVTTLSLERTHVLLNDENATH